MGSTANTAEGWFGFGPKGNKNRIKNLQAGAVDNYNQANDALTPPTIPAPPRAFDAANAGAQAMTDAARRYRRQRGGGLSSTTINGAAGDPSAAPTFRKQLLGR